MTICATIATSQKERVPREIDRSSFAPREAYLRWRMIVKTRRESATLLLVTLNIKAGLAFDDREILRHPFGQL